MVRYAITDENVIPAELLRLAGVADLVQLRTPGWDAGDVLKLARILPAEMAAAKLLIHGRVDVASACGAAGVHLSARTGELTSSQVRRLMPEAIISVSCHTLEEVERARDNGADFILFSPVFEKTVGGHYVMEGAGLDALRAACTAAPARVIALGGVTRENMVACLAAGATGVAGIRFFQRGANGLTKRS
jgi:thiamine-phosphate pyrophosphorylase